MTPRALIAVLVLLFAALPVVLSATTPLDAGHAAVLKHMSRTPPPASRVALAGAWRAAAPAPLPCVGRSTAEPAGLVPDAASSAPFVPPRV